MVELDQPAVQGGRPAAAPEYYEVGDIDMLEDLQVVDRPRAEGRILVASVVALVVGGVALATVTALGLGLILDVAGILAR